MGVPPRHLLFIGFFQSKPSIFGYTPISGNRYFFFKGWISKSLKPSNFDRSKAGPQFQPHSAMGQRPMTPPGMGLRRSVCCRSIRRKARSGEVYLGGDHPTFGGSDECFFLAGKLETFGGTYGKLGFKAEEFGGAWWNMWIFFMNLSMKNGINMGLNGIKWWNLNMGEDFWCKGKNMGFSPLATTFVPSGSRGNCIEYHRIYFDKVNIFSQIVKATGDIRDDSISFSIDHL